jgi:hypothetical protein
MRSLCLFESPGESGDRRRVVSDDTPQLADPVGVGARCFEIISSGEMLSGVCIASAALIKLSLVIDRGARLPLTRTHGG